MGRQEPLAHEVLRQASLSDLHRGLPQMRAFVLIFGAAQQLALLFWSRDDATAGERWQLLLPGLVGLLLWLLISLALEAELRRQLNAHLVHLTLGERFNRAWTDAQLLVQPVELIIGGDMMDEGSLGMTDSHGMGYAFIRPYLKLESSYEEACGNAGARPWPTGHRLLRSGLPALLGLFLCAAWLSYFVFSSPTDIRYFMPALMLGLLPGLLTHLLLRAAVWSALLRYIPQSKL